jgi:hypothetical protein
MPQNPETRIDCDRYCADTRTLRHRARKAFHRRLVAYLRSLIGVAIIIGTFWMLASGNADCVPCGPRAGLSHTPPSLH